MRIIVIGGVAGGASAAARARRVNADAEILVIEKGKYISFANCGLPYHIGGEIRDRSKLLVASPELFWNRFRIQVQTEMEATHIDRNARLVAIRNLSTGLESTIEYDRLILSTGSQPFLPPSLAPLPSNAFHLWTLDDMDRIMATMKSTSQKRAAVIGAGFVGLEVVEQLHRQGFEVTLVERDPQVLRPMERLFARMVEQHLEARGVRIALGAQIERIVREGDLGVSLELQSGASIPFDLLIVGAGVVPRVGLAAQAGLDIGKTGGIVVNSSMQTSDSSIYAVGDIVELTHGVTGEPTRIPLAGSANRAGRIAGEHAASGHSEAMGTVLGTAIVRVFDLTAACTGLNEVALAARAIPFRTAIVQAASHASYYPGAQSMQLKILYTPVDGKILGAQAVGGEGVDKRIDVIATAMHFGGTVRQLAQLDLAYAPPFGSAKDPIHMVAFTACNDINGCPKLVLPTEDLTGKQVVDVRTAAERLERPLPGAISIEIDQLPLRWKELDPMQPTVVVCHSGKRAHVGACWLHKNGFADVSNMTGGMSVRSLRL